MKTAAVYKQMIIMHKKKSGISMRIGAVSGVIMRIAK